MYVVTQVIFFAEYKGPSPPPGSGDHRYQFVLYEQPNNFENDVTDDTERGKWNVEQYLAGNSIGFKSYVASFQFKSHND